MQSLLMYMQLAASKAAVHHESTSLPCACDNTCLAEDACLHAFCLNTGHALDVCLAKQVLIVECQGRVMVQLAPHQWHHRLLAVLEYHRIPWKGSWDLIPLGFAPGVFALKMQSLSIIGQGYFGRVHL